jgi:hypothetical protein
VLPPGSRDSSKLLGPTTPLLFIGGGMVLACDGRLLLLQMGHLCRGAPFCYDSSSYSLESLSWLLFAMLSNCSYCVERGAQMRHSNKQQCQGAQTNLGLSKRIAVEHFPFSHHRAGKAHFGFFVLRFWTALVTEMHLTAFVLEYMYFLDAL